MSIQVSDIAFLVNAEVKGDATIPIDGPCKIEEGKKGKITFLANPKYEHYIYETEASAVIVGTDFIAKEDVKPTLLIVENVYQSLAILFEKFNKTDEIALGVSSLASINETSEIADSAKVADFVYIGNNTKIGANVVLYPHVFIGDGVIIEEGTVLYSGSKIYHGCQIGKNCIIHANSVIGSDGFGFTPDGKGGVAKIQQLGNVVVEDEVEIGANSTIDRATMGSTIIKRGVKLDNMVHVAHNVVIDEQTMIAAQTGIAGSTKIGKYCMIGGQAGIMGHINIADNTSIQAKSGIGGNIKKEGTKWYGVPAIDYSTYLRSYAYYKQLPAMEKRIRELEKQLKS